MKRLRVAILAAITAIFVAAGAPGAQAQVSINVQIGTPPVCPYGYFGYAPYNCAPLGYYGPQWFQSGVFIGAGPWFGGPNGFRGYVDRYYDPRFGYRGVLPYRGERPDWAEHRGWERRFHGDYRAVEYRHDNGNHYGQYRNHRDNGHHYGQYQNHGNPRAYGRGNPHGNGHGYGRGRGRGNGHDHGNGHGHGRGH